MKLHTDFHDYYDNAVGYGIDENVHYNRFTKEVEINIKARADYPYNFDLCLLGFCGNIFPVIKINKLSHSRYSCEYEYDDYQVVEVYYAFSIDEANQKYQEQDDFCDGYYYLDGRELLQLKQFFIDWSFQSDEIFLLHKCPSWIFNLERNSTKGIINPKLKDYGFNRIKDSFTAFQEISMYLSNILVEQKEVAKIEDKFRIKQHGFDLKTSFRREKKP